MRRAYTEIDELKKMLKIQKNKYEVKLKEQFVYLDSLRADDLKKAKEKFDFIDLR